MEYAVVSDHDDTTGATEKLIIASALVETIAAKVKREFKVVNKLMGSKLIGLRYLPPFETLTYTP